MFCLLVINRNSIKPRPATSYPLRPFFRFRRKLIGFGVLVLKLDINHT